MQLKRGLVGFIITGRLVSQHINRLAVRQLSKHYKSISQLHEFSYNLKQHKPNLSFSRAWRRSAPACYLLFSICMDQDSCTFLSVLSQSLSLGRIDQLIFHSSAVRGFTITFLQACFLDDYLSYKKILEERAHWVLEQRYFHTLTKIDIFRAKCIRIVLI